MHIPSGWRLMSTAALIVLTVDNYLAFALIDWAPADARVRYIGYWRNDVGRYGPA